MTPRQLHRTAGLFLVAIPVAFTVCFTLLAQQFEYPDILRQPTGAVLTKFLSANKPWVKLTVW